MVRGLGSVLIALSAIAAVYVFRAPLSVFAHQTYRLIAPCTVSIGYRLENLDERFGLSEKDALGYLARAEEIWEKAAGKELFYYDPQGTLAVTFLYDDRQARTERLGELGVQIDAGLENYEAVKAQYEGARSAYLAKKAAFERDNEAFERRVAAYETEVARWNGRGGAPRSEIARLEREQSQLESESAQLSARADALNREADDLNALADATNRLARAVNRTAADYRADATDEEFEEAVYESVPGNERIVVFEYGSVQALIRVLAHEFGHALSLEHVEDPEALMYELNTGSSLEATADDREELARACRK